MSVVIRVFRCSLAALVAFLVSRWLLSIDLAPFLPARWSFGAVDLASAVILGTVGCAIGILAAGIIAGDDHAPAWPVWAYVVGAVAYVAVSVGGIQGVVVGQPMGLRWAWWSLVALSPAVGAALALVIRPRLSKLHSGHAHEHGTAA